MHKAKFLLPVASLLLLLGCFYQALAPKPKKHPLLGQRVPALSLKYLNGQDTSMRAYQGQDYVLNIWATWCDNCRAEHEVLAQIKAQGLLVLGVNYKEDPSTIQTYLNEEGNPFSAVLLDSQGRLSLQLGIEGTPETFVINRQGLIIGHHRGRMHHADWRQKLAPLLASQP